MGPQKTDHDLRLNYLFANLYLQKKDTALAETFFKKCFDVNTDSIYTNTEHYMEACLLYSEFKKDQGNYPSALHYTYLAYKYALKGQSKRYIADASEHLFKLYEATRQTDSAYFYLHQTLIYKDSISNAVVQSQIQNTLLLLHLDEKGKEVMMLEDKMRHRQNVQYIAITIGLITLLVLFFLFSHSILIGTKAIEFIGNVVMLMVFEFVFLFIHPYLGKWSDESPLIMLLSLVLIALLLTPMHHKIENWVKQELIRKNNKVRMKHAQKAQKHLEETKEDVQQGP